MSRRRLRSLPLAEPAAPTPPPPVGVLEQRCAKLEAELQRAQQQAQHHANQAQGWTNRAIFLEGQLTLVKELIATPATETTPAPPPADAKNQAP